MGRFHLHKPYLGPRQTNIVWTNLGPLYLPFRFPWIDADAVCPRRHSSTGCSSLHTLAYSRALTHGRILASQSRVLPLCALRRSTSQREVAAEVIPPSGSRLLPRRAATRHLPARAVVHCFQGSPLMLRRFGVADGFPQKRCLQVRQGHCLRPGARSCPARHANSCGHSRALASPAKRAPPGAAADGTWPPFLQTSRQCVAVASAPPSTCFARSSDRTPRWQGSLRYAAARPSFWSLCRPTVNCLLAFYCLPGIPFLPLSNSYLGWPLASSDLLADVWTLVRAGLACRAEPYWDEPWGC